jgi:hypothetical protein
LNLVPALRHDKREIRVNDEGSPTLEALSGAEEDGIVIVRTKPRIADVRILELSNASLSRATSLDRNLTKGPIMYEFQRNDSSRLSTSKVEASVDLV